MRERVWVHERIANEETVRAVDVLANALADAKVCSLDIAKEQICRLLGWLCNLSS